MKKESIHIVIASDANYFIGLRVAIKSAIFFNKKDPFVFHILDGGIDKNHLEKFIEEVQLEQLVDIEVNTYDVDVTQFASFTDLVGSKMQYARLLIPSLIKEPKVIYIDCDVLVLKNIRELWEHKMIDELAVVVKDRKLSFLKEDWQMDYEAPDAPYFNSGVMLINVEGWRQKDIQRETLSLLNNKPEKFLFWDQSALNVTLCDQLIYTDRRFNFSADTFDLADVRAPVILHYLTRYSNPWERVIVDDASLLWVTFYENHVDGVIDQWKYYKLKLRYLRSLKDRWIGNNFLLNNLNHIFLNVKKSFATEEGKVLIRSRQKNYRIQFSNRASNKIATAKMVSKYINNLIDK